MMKNKKLSRHIADAAWNSFVIKLEYKAKAMGHHVVKIDQWFAISKTCHFCGNVVEKMPLSIRTWKCTFCSTIHDRDINAAINIHNKGLLILKAAGLAVSACGGLRNSCSLQVAA